MTPPPIEKSRSLKPRRSSNLTVSGALRVPCASACVNALTNTYKTLDEHVFLQREIVRSVKGVTKHRHQRDLSAYEDDYDSKVSCPTEALVRCNTHLRSTTGTLTCPGYPCSGKKGVQHQFPDNRIGLSNIPVDSNLPSVLP